MRARIKLLAGFILLILPAVAWSEINWQKLSQVDSLECYFPCQIFGYWDRGVVFTGITEPPSDNETVRIEISAIDIVKGRALFRTAWEDNYEVKILNNIEGLTLLDVSPVGNVRMVTVYPSFCPDRRAFCSLLSEHGGGLGVASPSQAFGFCEVK
jgi:hypothetical protein